MDMKKDCKIPNCGSWRELPGTKIVAGAKQLRKALLAGRARYVFLARDADPGITEPIEEFCREHSVQYTWVPTMTQLGSACGIEVGAAAAAAVSHNGSTGQSSVE